MCILTVAVNCELQQPSEQLQVRCDQVMNVIEECMQRSHIYNVCVKANANGMLNTWMSQDYQVRLEC